MLKIRDDIDLKGLEKYGFKNEYEDYIKRFPERINDKNIETWKYYVYGYDKYDIVIYVDIKTKILTSGGLWGYCEEDTDSHLEVLYDLIKDGLVEKVEE